MNKYVQVLWNVFVAGMRCELYSRYVERGLLNLEHVICARLSATCRNSGFDSRTRIRRTAIHTVLKDNQLDVRMAFKPGRMRKVRPSWPLL